MAFCLRGDGFREHREKRVEVETGSYCESLELLRGEELLEPRPHSQPILELRPERGLGLQGSVSSYKIKQLCLRVYVNHSR